jgi:hypothetical protein
MYRIQIDIGHGSENGALVAQRLAFEAAFPESSLAAVFAVGTAGDGLDEAAHQPGEVAEALAQRLDPDGVGQQSQAFGFDGVVAVLAGREQADPALGNLVIGPAQRLARIDVQHQMQVVAHDGVGVDRDGEALGDEADALLDPAPAMFEGPTAVVVDAAEERPPDAALDAVEGAGAVMWCDVRAGPGHASVLRRPDDRNVGEVLI